MRDLLLDLFKRQLGSLKLRVGALPALFSFQDFLLGRLQPLLDGVMLTLGHLDFVQGIPKQIFKTLQPLLGRMELLIQLCTLAPNQCQLFGKRCSKDLQVLPQADVLSLSTCDLFPERLQIGAWHVRRPARQSAAAAP